MKKCESCGKPYSESKDVFCPHCGAVASKKCTHGSSFDSSKWDRGEVYQNNENTYSHGSEPHAQRTGYNSEPDSGNSYEPKKTTGFPLDLPGMFTGDKIKKIVGAIVAVVTVLPVIISFFGGVFDFTDLDTGYDGYDYEYYDDTYYEDEVDLISVGRASVTVNDMDGMWFTFNLNMEDAYFTGLDFGFVEVLSNGDYTTDINIITFDKGVVDSGDLSSSGSYVFSGVQTDVNGCIDFSNQDFSYDEMILISKLEIIANYGSMTVELPFDAFSCSPDGNITYYRMNEEKMFEECEPEAEVEDYQTYYSFTTDEFTLEDLTEVVSVVPDEYEEV